MTATLDGNVTPLSDSAPGVAHYHPKPSPGGTWLAFGSTRSGNRQLYIAPSGGGDARPITHVPAGYGAMWAHWEPGAA
jgi:Tol biopolymer transport system component